MKNIKEFATMPLKKKFSTITQHKFKSVFYSWFVASDLHTATMTTDLLLNLSKHKLSSDCTETLKKITYSTSIKRIFHGIFVDYGHQEGKYIILPSTATVSGHQYTYCPTIVFLYGLYKKFHSIKKN